MSIFANPLHSAVLAAYPVGSIYMSVNATSPATLFGGTWERIQGRFLFAADNSHAAGSTGGKSSISVDFSDGGFAQIGMVHSNYEHDIGMNSVGDDNGRWFAASWKRTFQDAVDYQSPAATGIEGTPLAGHTSPISILPPYLSVYMWKRTA